jgi:hypothetical protein
MMNRTMRVLGRVPQRQLAGRRGELRHRAARLHGRRNQPLLDDAIADDDAGRLECARHVAPLDDPVEGQVARRFRVQLWRAVRGRLVRVNHGWQRFVVDVDQLERVVRLIVRFSHDDGDGVADVADDVDRDGAVRGDVQPGIRQEPGAGNALQPGLGVGPGEDGHHARRAAGAAGIEAANPGVSVGTPQNRRMEHARKREIGGVAGRAGQEPRVLAAPDARTEDACPPRSSAHLAPPIPADRGSAAAACTARTMFW